MMTGSVSSNWQRLFLMTATLALVTALLYFGKSVLIPVVLAILFTFLLAPVVTALQRRGLGRVTAALIVVSITFTLLAGSCWAMVLQMKSLLEDLPQHKARIQEKIASVQAFGKESWFGDVTDTITDINKSIKENEADPLIPEPRPAPVSVTLESSMLPVLQSAFMPVVDTLIAAGLVLVLVVFMLINREDLRNRLICLWGNGSVTTMTKALDDAGHRLSRFLLMQFLINTAYGVVVGLGLFLIGLPYPILWGFLTATIRYIPYLGPWVSALFPIALSLAVAPNWTQPILVAGLFLALEIISSNFIEPLLYGHSIGASEVALLVAAAFWGWLWGPIGLVLSTPLTACLVVLGRYVPHLEFLNVLLGDKPVLETHVSFFQRLLARDLDEAVNLVETALADHSVEEVYDTVLIPALVMTKASRERDEFTAEDERAILRRTRTIMEDVLIPRLDESTADTTENGSAKPAARHKTTAMLIMGSPTGDATEHLALEMLGSMLYAEPCRYEMLPTETLSAELIERIRAEEPAAICLAVLPPQGLAHARSLCKRLRTVFPQLKILVGCWGLANEEKARDHLVASGADQMATTLQGTREQLLAVLQAPPHRHDKASPSARRRERQKR